MIDIFSFPSTFVHASNWRISSKHLIQVNRVLVLIFMRISIGMLMIFFLFPLWFVLNPLELL
jgi:hypothetical protein